MLKKNCIVIPVHSASPSINELISFKRCFTILGLHDIYVVAPAHLNLTAYHEVVNSFTVKTVPAEWLCSIKEYNKMKISPAFYSLFSEYEFMLTYELDAYVFRDELDNWCNKEIDYIGAPFFAGFDKQDADAEMIGVGNSGFSLRNIQACLGVLNQLKQHIRIAGWFNFFRVGFLLKGFVLYERLRPGSILKNIRIIRAYIDVDYMHEDTFWSFFIPKLFPGFRIAGVADALTFSFDSNPATCYHLLGNTLPFGCHAWPKYDPEFWKPFIAEST